MADCVTLQKDLDSLAVWEKCWGMEYHPDKCTIMRITRKRRPLTFTYSLRGHILEDVDHATYLGIELTSNLSWNRHVSKVCAKANRTLGFVKRNVVTSSIQAKNTAYKSLVRPQLEYAAAVWHPHTADLTSSLEKIQRRAARYVLHQYQYTASVTQMLLRLKWETLQHRRMKLRLLLMYKIIHGLVAINPQPYFIPTLRLNRYNHSFTFQQISTTKQYHQASYFINSIPLWNAAPACLIEAPDLDKFRVELAKYAI